MKSFPEKILKWALLLAVLLVFSTMTWRKATSAGLTHDEAITYTQFVPKPILEIISYKGSFTNNHILNTLLIKASTFLFGNHEWAIRLPNLLAHFAFVCFTFLIAFRFFKGLKCVFAFLLMNSNPYLLDFFALGRGYGIAIGLMTGALYFFLLFVSERKPKHYHIALFLLLLAAWANFALLLVFAAILIIYQFLLLMEKPRLRKWLKLNAGTLIAIIVLVIVFWEPLRLVQKNKMIDFGGTQGLWDDTVMSLIRESLFSARQDSWWLNFFIVVVIFHNILLPLVWVMALFEKGKIVFREHSVMFCMNLILIFVTGLHLFQHAVMGTPFLMQRFALFLVPIFTLNLLLLMNYFSERKNFGWISTGAMGILAALLFYHTLAHFSMQNFRNWKYDSDTQFVLQKMDEDRKKHKLETVQLGITWEYEPVLNYYRLKNNLTWLQPLTRDKPAPENDYFFINLYEPQKMPVAVDTLMTIKEWPSALFRNREKHPG